MTTMRVEYEDNHSTIVKSVETGASIRTDVPAAYGGKGKEMSPTDLFAASLGACILSMMGMQAKRLGLSFQGVTAMVTKNQGATPGGIGEITVHVYSKEAFDESTREKLEKAAKNCPVHHCIDSKVKQDVQFHWGATP